jgi:hypothetical protein
VTKEPKMMSNKQRIVARRLAVALVAAAAATPSVAQATDGPAAPAGGALSGPAVAGLAAPQAQPGFRWDDAGIGAAAMLAVLGSGSVATAASRRRRTRRTLAG